MSTPPSFALYSFPRLTCALGYFFFLPGDTGSQSKFLVYKDLSELDIERLRRCSNQQQQRDYLTYCLKLKEYYIDRSPTQDKTIPQRVIAQSHSHAQALASVAATAGDENIGNTKRRAVFLDLALSVLNFAHRQTFPAVKTSTLFSIVTTTHQYACERLGPPPTTASAHEFFEQLLLMHSVERPPFSIQIFSVKDVQHISTFMVEHYFRHLRMYQYVFVTSKHLLVASSYSIAQKVQVSEVLPLSSAIQYYSSTEQIDPFASADDDAAAQDNDGEGKGEDDDLAGDAAHYDELSDDEYQTTRAQPRSKYLDPTTRSDSTGGGDASTSADSVFGKVLSDPKEQKAFESALGQQMSALQADLAGKLEQQQKEFLQKLSALEAGASTGRGRKHAARKK